MPKNYSLRELTIEIIREKELPKKKILEQIRRKSGKSISDKTLNEILMSLLKEREIYITGYDFDVYKGMKRIQSIKAEGIIFGLIKTDPLEIGLLINQLESDDPSLVRNALYELKMIFKKKVDQMKGLLTPEIKMQDTDGIFNKMVFYIKSQSPDQKLVLKNKLAWSLSDEEESAELFEHFINYIKSQK
ncbi:MAG: hypothetical protein HZC47_11475 [Methanobacterium sp.]|uniref:hypothetical protein n=1 Tax=Methanobacterium sp. TaxID=2164 RepID=UPI003D65CFB4|nr:hypothetical protein [Methanobacterium sp.]